MVWLATHSDIHGFIVILITTLEQSYHCPCFRVGVTEPQKKIHWFPPGSTWSRSCVRDLNLGLLTPSFIFVTTHSIELQIPNFPLQPCGGIAAVWGEGDNVHFTWGHIREWIRSNKPSGHQSRIQVAGSKEVCSESGIPAKPIILQQPRWSRATEFCEKGGFFCSFRKAWSVGWAGLFDDPFEPIDIIEANHPFDWMPWSSTLVMHFFRARFFLFCF